MSHDRYVLWFAVSAAVVVPRALPAQADDAAARLDAAAHTITATELARHAELLAADSFQGRATQDAGVEATARYVAAAFRQLGLRPGRPWMGDADSTWRYRYPLPVADARRLLDTAAAASWLRLSGAVQGARATPQGLVEEQGRPIMRVAQLDFVTTARLAADSLAASSLGQGKKARVQVVTGRHTVASLRHLGAPAPLLSREPLLVLYVPPIGLDSATQAAVLAHLTTIACVVVVAPEEAATFAVRRTAAQMPRIVVDTAFEESLGARAWAVYVAAEPVAAVLRAVGLDLTQLWADTTPRLKELPGLGVDYQLTFPASRDTATGVNVIGWLKGSDSVWKESPEGRPLLPAPMALSYVVYTAPLDGWSPTTGANDNAGIAGLLALAKAFSQPGARPERSVMFLATSGAREHFAGASAFVQQTLFSEEHLLNITLDGIGPKAGDTLPVAGLRDFVFPHRPEWLTAAHPELGLTLVDGGTVLDPTSNHYAFARNGLPNFLLPIGRPEGTASDPDRAVRVARFAFYLGQDFAGRRDWPTWTTAARMELVRRRGR